MTSELTDPSPDAELADLVSKYLDNRLSSTERVRLESRIQNETSAIDYLAKRLRFEATLRETINPQRMEVLESRRMIMEPGADGPEWSVEQQRSVRIGRQEEPLTLDVSHAVKRRRRWLYAIPAILAVASAAFLLLPRPDPQPTSLAPTLSLRNADFEATDLSLTPQGFTSTLVNWQEAFACAEVELVEISRHSQGKIFPKSGKNVARLMPGGYINQFLHYNDGSPVRARDGLNLRLSGWAWLDTNVPKTISTSLRVVASGRPDTIIYDACKCNITLESPGWQPFRVELPISGNLMRNPYWVEPRVTNKPPLDLTGRELCLSIDMEDIRSAILLDDLKIEEVLAHDDATLQHVTLALHHSRAAIRGDAVREQDKDCIGNWHNHQTAVLWKIRVNRTCEVNIECMQAAESRSDGNGYDVVIGEEKISGKVVTTGAWDRFEIFKVGSLTIPTAGEYEVTVVPHAKDTQAVMNLRSLRLSGPHLSAEILPPP
jgi:hypothetical protein